MSFALSVHDFRFGAKASALTFSLKPGQIMAVFGPSGSGKTRFVRSICGLERSYKGSIRLGGQVALAGHPAIGKRLTPETIARRAAGRGGATKVAEALTASRLWDERRTPFGNLTPGQQAASDMLGALASQAPLIVLDGTLDRLDPWTRTSVWELLKRRLTEGAAILLCTGLPEFALLADLVLVWKSGSPAYAGSYTELERRHGVTRLEIETLHDRGVRALCDPFEVAIESSKGGLKIKAKDGQALAARMLLEGYGDLKAVVARPPTADELLREL